MKNNNQVTLNNFFSSGGEPSQNRLTKVESSEKLSAVKEKISKLKKDMWPMAFSKMEEGIEGILNIDIPDIMVMAWKKYASLLKYTDKVKYPPEEINLVELAEHIVKSEHNPYIDIIFNGKSIDKIKFNITLTLTLKGIILKIKDGRIMEVFTGNCAGKGILKCEGIEILEKKSETINFPGSFKLGDGIPIVG